MRTASLVEVAKENRRRGLDIAEDVGGDWLARWDTVNSVIEYYNIQTYATAATADEAKMIDVIDAAPEPGRPWSKSWDRDAKCVVYVNEVTGKSAATLADVNVANELHRAPDPGEGWAKVRYPWVCVSRTWSEVDQ